MSRIAKIFDEICRNNEEKVAIYFSENGLKKRTFGELSLDIETCIKYLDAQDVKAGDRVFIFAPISYKLVVFMIAAFKLGIQVMFLDINARQETFEKLFKKFRPKYVLVSRETKYLYLLFSKLGHGLKILNLDEIGSSQNELLQGLPDLSDNTPALLTTTTGSTGVPKIVVRSHMDLFNQLELIGKNLPKNNHDVVMSTSFIYIFAVLARGNTAVLPQINLKASRRKINERLGIFGKLPISIIITSPVFGLKADNIYSKLRQLYIGGASISLQEAEVIQNKFPNSKNYLVYGATECNIMAEVPLPTYIHELRSHFRSTLGKPCEGVSIKIDSDESILVSCNALIKGFVDENSEYALRDGDWYNTNDKGYIENDILYYRGKYDNYITFHDKKYYSHEIEQYLSVRFPECKKCAIVQKHGKIYLFGSERKYAKLLSDALYEKFGFQVEYKYIRKLPHDVRHHTKTDYRKLLSLVGEDKWTCKS